jgi:iduronate 2-sulfatase
MCSSDHGRGGVADSRGHTCSFAARRCAFGAGLLVGALDVGADAAAAVVHSGTDRASSPNILFIAVDDLRPVLGCYGDEVIRSPNIDGFARSGVVFDRAYCQFAMCAPSRASVLTGLRPGSAGVRDLYSNFRTAQPGIHSLPEWFKKHGYYTDRVGKVFHLDDVASWTPRYPAPDFGPMNPEKRAPYASAAINEAGWKKFDEAKAKGATGMELERSQRGPAVEIADVEDDELLDGQIARDAVESLRSFAGARRPFFLAVGFHKPHLPFVAPKRYWELYDRDELPVATNAEPPSNAPHALGDGVEFFSYVDVPPERPIPEDYARLARHGYFACVSYVDAMIGRVLDELKHLGLADDTIVVLWGDHGFKLGEHGGWAKLSNFELDARVPLIVRVPGLSQGTRVNGIVELLDLYPTLVEIAGLPFPGHLQGTSFSRLLHNPTDSGKSVALTECTRPGGWLGVSMRTEVFRFTRWSNVGGPDSHELYDHRTDPNETMNLAGLPEWAAVERDLDRQLSALLFQEGLAGR